VRAARDRRARAAQRRGRHGRALPDLDRDRHGLHLSGGEVGVPYS
jgi:hypothetical protein